MSELLAIEPVHIDKEKESSALFLSAAVLCAAFVVRTWLQLERHVTRLEQGKEKTTQKI